MTENATGPESGEMRQMTLEEGLKAARENARAELQWLADMSVRPGYEAKAQPYQGRVRLVIAVKGHTGVVGEGR